MCMKSQDHYYWNEQWAEFKCQILKYSNVGQNKHWCNAEVFQFELYYISTRTFLYIELASEGRWSDLAREWEPRLATALAEHWMPKYGQLWLEQDPDYSTRPSVLNCGRSRPVAKSACYFAGDKEPAAFSCRWLIF